MASFEFSVNVSFFFFFFLVFWFPLLSADSVETCQKTSCFHVGPTVRFPFRLKNQPFRCGYKGFSLSCDKQNRTILNLPFSGDFTVQMIEYDKQSVSINDPDGCLPKRFLNRDFVNISNLPFSASEYHVKNFTFLNCSSEATASSHLGPYGISCLSSKDYTVYALPTIYAQSLTSASSESPSPSPSTSCSVIATAWVPLPLQRQSFQTLDDDIQLTWQEPSCGECEARGGNCGYRVNQSKVGCSVSAKSSSGGNLL